MKRTGSIFLVNFFNIQDNNILSVIIWLTDFACYDWSTSVQFRKQLYGSQDQTSSSLSQNNHLSHTINILLASFARSVGQVMDPRFFPSLFS